MKERDLVKDKRLRWEDGIRMDLRKIAWVGDVQSAYDRGR
jgi:hypothetical protein